MRRPHIFTVTPLLAEIGARARGGLIMGDLQFGAD